MSVVSRVAPHAGVVLPRLLADEVGVTAGLRRVPAAGAIPGVLGFHPLDDVMHAHRRGASHAAPGLVNLVAMRRTGKAVPFTAVVM